LVWNIDTRRIWWFGFWNNWYECCFTRSAVKLLRPLPLFATAVLGAYALKEFGSEEQKSKYLPLIVDGSITTAIAIDESSHHDPANTELEAKVSNAGILIKWEKAASC
jgi:alkylation response protein AidB-like acyl-CoA dehydrogenase